LGEKGAVFVSDGGEKHIKGKHGKIDPERCEEKPLAIGHCQSYYQRERDGARQNFLRNRFPYLDGFVHEWGVHKEPW
jgi:hypothetical protein